MRFFVKRDALSCLAVGVEIVVSLLFRLSWLHWVIQCISGLMLLEASREKYWHGLNSGCCVKNGQSAPWSWGSSSGVLVGWSFMSGGDVDDFNCHSWCEGFVWQLSFLVMVDFGFCTCLLIWRNLDTFERWSDLYDWCPGNVFIVPRV